MDRWNEIFLDKFCPHVDWVNKRANFILHLQADMEVANQKHQWFKFLLRHQGGRYTRLEHTVYTEKKSLLSETIKEIGLILNCIPPHSLLILGLRHFFMVSSFAMKILFYTIHMWKDVLVPICILPSLLKIRIHHVITLMMMMTALVSIVSVEDSTSVVQLEKSAFVTMHVILTTENFLLYRKAVVGQSLPLHFFYCQESLSVLLALSVKQSVCHNEF